MNKPRPAKRVQHSFKPYQLLVYILLQALLLSLVSKIHLTYMQPGIKVFAPASVGNAAVGFDVMGFALEQPGDEIIVRFSDKPGLRITLISGAQGKLPHDPQKNTAGFAALNF